MDRMCVFGLASAVTARVCGALAVVEVRVAAALQDGSRVLSCAR